MASHLRRGFFMGLFIDLAGLRFGRLTVLHREGRAGSGHATWKCLCDCGNSIVTSSNCLRTGTKSCSCLQKEAAHATRFKHGGSHSGGRAYHTWKRMRERCLNPKGVRFSYYGGRGIGICSRWEEFSAFLADMGEPGPGTSLDRIDNSKGYAPDNCRWATRTEQSRNRRCTKLTLEKAREIRQDYRTYQEIAEDYMVSEATGYNVKKGRTWKELPTDTPPATPTT